MTLILKQSLNLEESSCIICGLEDNFDNNVIIICDLCNAATH